MKTELKRLENLIRSFEALVERFPKKDAYRDSLAKLRQDRVNLVDKIGR